MGQVKDKPAGLKSTNELDKHPDEDGGAELRLGSNVLIVMDEPPALCDNIDIVVRLRVVDKGVSKETADSDETAYRRCRLVTAWPLGKKPPASADENQGSMLDVVDGNPVPSAEATGEDEVVDAEVIDSPDFSDEG